MTHLANKKRKVTDGLSALPMVVIGLAEIGRWKSTGNATKDPDADATILTILKKLNMRQRRIWHHTYTTWKSEIFDHY
jgi:hypothetical protein